jgi:hypothetical protein
MRGRPDDGRGRRLDSSQELAEMVGGMVRLRMRLNSLEEIERWVLSMGTHCTVVRPRALGERLVAMGRWLGEVWWCGGINGLMD